MIVYHGTCPVCEKATRFESPDTWFRDNLRCVECDSIPRERAFAWALDRFAPNWRKLMVHESSPADRAVSLKLRDGCRNYVPSQFFPDVPGGQMHQGMRSENLEALSFPDLSVDLHVHLDVLEHVNRPDLCLREMARTLKAGGMAIFTTPVYHEKAATERRAVYFPDGAEHLAPAEYHGNPISDEGALVTHHYGRNFSDLMRMWAPELFVVQVLLNDARIGVVGEFRDVFVLTRNNA